MTKKYKVGIDGGHGMETAGKRTPAIPELGGRVIRENEFNDAVAVKLQKALERCGFDTMFTAPETSDTSLSARVARANASKVDILVSLHYNAITASFATAKASGYEVLAGSSSASKKLAKCILDELGAGTPQKNRGVKDGSWLALNKCKMPLALVEYGFMDNKTEALLMIDSKFIEECAEETAKGICKYFGVKYVPSKSTSTPAPKPSKPAQKPTPSKKTIYRVIVDGKQVGAYAEGDNLLDQARKSMASGAKNIKIEKV
jgi:N-acetylmuramoyl-L-alanine amidase